MGIFRRKTYIETGCFSLVINDLARAFESLREDYIFGSLSQLKREGVDVSGIARDVVPGSELEDASKGYQLTSMMGIAWDYIRDARDQLEFDRLLSASLGAEEGSRASNFRERYLDCRGDIDALAKALSVDVHRAIGSPEPRTEFLIQFQGGAVLLGGLCQVETYRACGDDRMALSLRRRITRRQS
ncbi:MAG: hypothetical protein A2Z18_00040 [Armatimonadetes bacterium RBG_16_58_9]|nr:MAG: hypothetical protein A2Z18_00040 [Armatimonadetes bacterium RBG_16_58_9]